VSPLRRKRRGEKNLTRIEKKGKGRGGKKRGSIPPDSDHLMPSFLPWAWHPPPGEGKIRRRKKKKALKICFLLDCSPEREPFPGGGKKGKRKGKRGSRNGSLAPSFVRVACLPSQHQ